MISLPQDPSHADHELHNPNGGLDVSLGVAQTPDARSVPVLQPEVQSLSAADDAASTSHSNVAEGMVFDGNAVLSGPCSVSGTVHGNLTQAHGKQVAVVVTETGKIIGDIHANKISVMGHTHGTLDASGGSVSINATASVSGHVRYTKLQVNGADLNATLERVAGDGAPATPRHDG